MYLLMGRRVLLPYHGIMGCQLSWACHFGPSSCPFYKISLCPFDKIEIKYQSKVSILLVTVWLKGSQFCLQSLQPHYHTVTLLCAWLLYFEGYKWSRPNCVQSTSKLTIPIVATSKGNPSNTLNVHNSCYAFVQCIWL